MPEGAGPLLNKEFKIIILLTIFSLLLSEYLTWTTLALVGLTSVALILKFKVSRIVRIVLAIGILASYFLIYGKFIDPEVGLNFLVSVISLKILERESKRDEYMIFFGLILLFSAGALFEKTLTYAIFYAFAFMTLVFEFYSNLNMRWRLKDLMVSMLWVFPLTAVLFFLAPRMMTPMGFGGQGPSEGRVGYTPDLNVSDVEELQSNTEPVFHAVIDRSISQRELYWRGNVLIDTDGWNWRAARERSVEMLDQSAPIQGGLRQEIFLLSSADFYYGLDWPGAFKVGERVIIPGQTWTVAQHSRFPVTRYEAISIPKLAENIDEERSGYQKLILSRKDREMIHMLFPGDNLEEVISSVRRYFNEEKFSYTFSPGKIRSFNEFLEKKQGFCSHFASALGIILRVKGYPVRLVSGFMGGTYNQFADYYLITQNDAHAWVEVKNQDRWMRLDPTEWIAPLRVELGGDAFAVATAKEGPLAAMGFRLNFGFLQDARLWFNQWDFLFYRWLDQMDYYGQIQLLSKLNIQKKWLFFIIPAIIVTFAFCYFILLQLSSAKKKTKSDIEQAWEIFLRKLRSRGITAPPVSVRESSRMIQESQLPESKELQNIFDELTRLSFGKCENSVLSELMKRVRRL